MIRLGCRTASLSLLSLYYSLIKDIPKALLVNLSSFEVRAVEVEAAECNQAKRRQPVPGAPSRPKSNTGF